MTTPHIACNCTECARGLWCADGQRGQFARGEDACGLCGVVAWRHSRAEPKRKAVTA